MAKPIEEAMGVWAIYFRPKGVFIKFGAKCGWWGSGPARKAFWTHTGKKVDDCEGFEVVCLSKMFCDIQKEEE